MNGSFFPGANAFRLYAERGLPLDVTVSLAFDRGYTIEWPSFISEATKNGWSASRTYNAIVSAVRDAAVFDQKQMAEFTDLAQRYFSSTVFQEAQP